MLQAVVSGDKLEVNLNLKQYKFANGAPNYDTILRIPFEDRLPGLVLKVGLKQVHMTLAAAITMTMESLNLSKPLTPDQIIDLTDILIDTSAEDYLSLEDVLLFMQQVSRGVMGELYSSIDIPKIMKSFEKYRQERHSEYKRLKDEQDVQYKIMGVNNTRVTIERDKNIDPKTFLELWKTFQDGKNENMDGDGN